MSDSFTSGIYRNSADDTGNRTLGTDEVVDGCSSCLCLVDCVLILLTPARGRCLLCNSAASFVAVSIATCMSKAFLYLRSGPDRSFFWICSFLRPNKSVSQGLVKCVYKLTKFTKLSQGSIILSHSSPPVDHLCGNENVKIKTNGFVAKCSLRIFVRSP